MSSLSLSSAFAGSPALSYQSDSHEQLTSNPGRSKLDFAERDQCKPVLLRELSYMESGKNESVENVKLTFGQPFLALTHQEQNPTDQNQRKEPNHDLVREPRIVIKL
jgi:hypothetical protein